MTKVFKPIDFDLFNPIEFGGIRKSFKLQSKDKVFNLFAADPKDEETEGEDIPEETEEVPDIEETSEEPTEEPSEEADEDVSDEVEEPIEEEEIEDEEADISDIKSALLEAAKKQLLLKVTYRDRDGNVTEGRYIEPWEIRDQYVFAGDNYGDPSTSGETGTKQFIMAAFSDWELSEEPYQNPAGYPIKIK